MNNKLVERLIGERESKLFGGIYHQTQVEMSYNSNKIEGSRLSVKQTRLLFEKVCFHLLKMVQTVH